MKLCYIWIQEYKGFVNQGFNFSTEFTFSFDAAHSALSKTNIDTYIENFFGDRIIEVTGIIGKNASGKTNILELIQYVASSGNTIIAAPFIVVIHLHGEKFNVYHHLIHEIKVNFSAELQQYQRKIPEFNSIFFSNVFDGRRHNFGKETINISTNDLLSSQFGENANKNFQRIIQQQIRFINSNEFEYLEDIDTSVDSQSIKPSGIILTSPIWPNILSRSKAFDQEHQEVGFSLRGFTLDFRRKIKEFSSPEILYLFTAFLVFIDVLLNRDILKGKQINGSRGKLQLFKTLKRFSTPNYHMRELYRYFITDFAEIIKVSWDFTDTSKFLHNLPRYKLRNKIPDDFRRDIGKYNNRKIQFTLPYNQDTGKFLIDYLNAITNQSLSYSVEWSGLSSGHKAYINLFANFYSTRSRLKENYTLICIDEGDLYFHPQWQTEFLYKLVNVLPQLLNTHCQLFLTTHSPFLVSDLPKDNLIFVDRTVENTLRVIPNEQIEGGTFGGNIGELYLDAFFMKGSLISHFAAQKIKDLIDKIRLSNSTLTKKDLRLIDKIGDTLIKKQLNKMIDGKNR